MTSLLSNFVNVFIKRTNFAFPLEQQNFETIKRRFAFWKGDGINGPIEYWKLLDYRHPVTGWQVYDLDLSKSAGVSNEFTKLKSSTIFRNTFH